MSTQPHQRPTGRRTGDSGTREAILDAALRLFAERGYDRASLRAIAAEAGVDPALIRHFFGDKDALFTTVVASRTGIPQRLAEAAGERSSRRGQAVTETYLGLWEDPETRPILLALVRSAMTSESATQMLRHALTTQVGHLDDDSRRRLTLAAAHLFGVAIARHVIKLEPVAELSHDELVEEVAPTIQRYLAGNHR